MARLPYPSRESRPAELAELLESLPRNNITEMFAHATSLPAPFLRLAQAQFTALELNVRQRELVILAVAGLVDCEYEYEYEYAQNISVSAAPRIADDVFERTRQLLSARQIVEALQLVGFYWALGRMCTVLELELDHPAGLDSVQAVASLHG
jgi:alkylhydroperoxidase family enzyme